MKLFAAAVSAVLVAGCTSFDEKQAHNEAQIRMIQVQREAQLQERVAEAEAKKALYEALRAVAVANPDHAPAVTVALAVQGLGGEEEGSTQVIQLQRQQNEALEYVKVLATPILNTATALGVAAITADVQKNASDNAAKVQINDSIQDANIIDSVANLGVAATNQVGIEVTGDYYDLQDSATLDQSTSADTDASIDYTLTDEAFVNTGTINENSNNTSGDTDASVTSGDAYTDSNNDNSIDDSDNSVTDTGT